MLRPGGRLALCDIVLQRPMPFDEVRRLREPLALLRDVFGDARMEPLAEYAELAAAPGSRSTTEIDLTAATRPTFDRWRENAERHRDEVVDAHSARTAGSSSWIRATCSRASGTTARSATACSPPPKP